MDVEERLEQIKNQIEKEANIKREKAIKQLNMLEAEGMRRTASGLEDAALILDEHIEEVAEVVE